jgi:hypothetical protein
MLETVSFEGLSWKLINSFNGKSGNGGECVSVIQERKKERGEG